ncbi:MAG: hypothetical protein KGR16_02660 [Verrucomicrobia bacterium]|nr:hypothetical protein [Verrucomicrobiota bacterium]MDE3048071.1 hypothetical protein [Verrucomicrobiota bacterium]
MCYNCEGEVDLDVIVCPYCAADLREEKPEQQAPHFNRAAAMKNMDTQQSLYPSQSPRMPRHEEESVEQTVVQAEEEPRGSYGPVLLLTLGAQLLILGLFMLLFSSKGLLVLKWDARFWYFYVLASVPLFVFGMKSLNKL